MADFDDTENNSAGTIKLSAVKSGDKAKSAVKGKTVKVAAVPKAATVKPTIVRSKDDDDGKPMKVVVKKQELVDRIVAMSDQKKNVVKDTLDAMLAVLGQALAAGEELQLPPLGKVKVQNSKEIGDGVKVHTLKVRTPKG